MFITVKYGDDKSEIFNPACRNCNLLQAIKFKCDLEKEDIVDLSDQTGIVKYLHKKPEEIASEFFEEREILILLRVEKQEEEGVKYVPMLADMKEDNDFIAKLNPEKLKSDRNHRKNSQETKSAKERNKQALQAPVNAGTKGRRQSRRFSKSDFTGLPLTIKK